MKPYGGFGVSASQLTKSQWHTIHNPSSKVDLDLLLQGVGEGEFKVDGGGGIHEGITRRASKKVGVE